MPRHSGTETTDSSFFATDGALACVNRFVYLTSDGYLRLAGATDVNVIGVGRASASGAVDVYTVVDDVRVRTGVAVCLFNSGWTLLVEVASAVTVAIGDPIYQAASGKCTNSSAGGAVKRGVALSAGDEGETIELLPC